MFVSRRERQHIEWAFRPKPQSPTDADLIALSSKRMEKLGVLDKEVEKLEASLPKVRQLRQEIKHESAKSG